MKKTIIYCWFGKGEKPKKVLNCIETWKKHMPDFKILEINEENFDIHYNKYVEKAYNEKKWAFVSDVARLWALYNYGGIYLDTDVEIYKSLEQFTKHELFTGWEQPNYPVCAVMGANKSNKIIKEMLDYYKDKEFITHTNWWEYETNTMIMSNIIGEYMDRNKYEYQENENIVVYPREYFCGGEYAKHLMLGSWRIGGGTMPKQKTIIIYQSHLCQIGGVETFLYNWCLELKNYYDIMVLYCSADEKQLMRLSKIVKVEKYNEKKQYECDIFFRNSVWGKVPNNVTSKDNRYLEMRHADYKYLLDNGLLYKQYTKMDKVNEIIACGEFVNKMSQEVMGDKPTTILNILAPKQKTNHILKLVSCTRIDSGKGWKRMQKLANMLREANIKFEWNIFTNSPQQNDYEEIHFYKQRFDIWDYLAEADYTVLLSDVERTTLHSTRKLTI